MITRNYSRKAGRRRTCTVKKIRALCPDLVSDRRGDGGADLWISLTKQMQKLQQQQMQLVEAAVRHKRKAAEQEERATESGKSISQLRMRLPVGTNSSEVGHGNSHGGVHDNSCVMWNLVMKIAGEQSRRG